MHYDIHEACQVEKFFFVNKNTLQNRKTFHCIFARLCYSLSMTEKEIQIQTLTAKIEQVAEDLLNPCLDNQTTVLLNHLGKLRKQLAALLEK